MGEVQVIDGTQTTGQRSMTFGGEVPEFGLEDKPKEEKTTKLESKDEGDQDLDNELEDYQVAEFESDEELDDESEEDDSDNDTEDEGEDVQVVSDSEYMTSMSDTQKTLKSYTKELELLTKRYEIAAPEKPKDEYDEEAMERYRHRLLRWEDRREEIQQDYDVIRAKVHEQAKLQEKHFREAHKGEDLDSFEKWVGERPHFHLAYLAGDETLEKLYKFYLTEEGQVRKDKKTIENLKKVNARFKPVKTKGKSSQGQASSGNGFPKQYKYANMSMFRNYVNQLKKEKVSPMTGKPYTAKYINELCQQEYQNLPLARKRK